MNPDAGTGIVDVGIVDPDGAKDTVRPTVIMRTEEVWYVEYTPKKKGLHSVNVNFAGKPITGSPFGVGVSPGMFIYTLVKIFFVFLLFQVIKY